ncbi:lysis system i-spanin subunit Rz [Pseudoxanthomonas dokdonensis]|uniref:lysis system i-spanin subunit Rz n=1 Tax=Pseudoxanthomonas dokdonensis TaxID=344882 RepID=UPI00070F5167|nr:lysis system i-spanin subunit Rz [Pseudoxanthomonas dokdonensis]
MILSELRANAWKYACILCAVLAVAAVMAALIFHASAADGHSRADSAEARAVAAEQALSQAKTALEVERAASERLAGIAATYESERDEIETQSSQLVADLRAGNVRLRKLWEAQAATANLSAAAASAASADGGARDRAESAGRIVRAADQCDAQVRGLQAVVRADRAIGAAE